MIKSIPKLGYPEPKLAISAPLACTARARVSLHLYPHKLQPLSQTAERCCTLLALKKSVRGMAAYETYFRGLSNLECTDMT